MSCRNNMVIGDSKKQLGFQSSFDNSLTNPSFKDYSVLSWLINFTLTFIFCNVQIYLFNSDEMQAVL